MLTSVHLLYTIFYINNIFIFFFNIILSLLFLFSYSSSSFFFLISLPFPLSFSFSSSSFFFFLSWSNQHSITSTTTIKIHQHYRSLLTHKHLSTPPTPIHITNPHAVAAIVTVMKSPLQSMIHDHRSMIHKQRSTIKAPQAPFQLTHSHKFTKMLSSSLSLLVCPCVGVFDF